MKKYLLLIVLLFGFELFDLNIINTTIAHFLSIVSIIIIAIGLVFKKEHILPYRFDKLIYVFFFGIAINIYIMKFYSNLSNYDTFFALLNYFGFLLYFFLHKYNFKENEIINIITGFAFVVSILMIFQQIVKPIQLFNQLALQDSFLDNRGTVRVRIPGMILVVFSYFYFLHNFIKFNKLKHILFAIFFLIVLILQGFRSITISILICSAFVYWYSGKSKYKITGKKIILLLIILGVSTIIITQVEYLNNILEEMIFQSEKDKKSSFENVRVLGIIYYLSTIKTEFWMYITGSGLRLPFKTPPNLFAVDLGFFGFYAMAGLIPAYAVLKLFIKSFMNAKSVRFIVGAGFFLYLILNCFLFNWEPFRTGIFQVFSLIFYLIDLRLYKEIKIIKN